VAGDSAAVTGPATRTPPAKPSSASATSHRGGATGSGDAATTPTRLDAATTPTPAASFPQRHLAAIIVGTILLLAVVATAAWGGHYFSSRAKPGVSLLGQDVTGQTATELTAAAAELNRCLSLRLTDGVTTVQATASDLGLSLDAAQSAKAALTAADQSPWWSAYNPWQDKPAAVALTIDQAKLTAYLDQAFIPADQAATEATVTYDPSQGAFVAQPGHDGLALQAETTAAAVRRAIAAGDAEPIRVAVEQKEPVFSTAAADQAATQANAHLALKLTLTNGQTGSGKRSYQVPAASLADWTVITPNPDTGAFDVSWDTAKLRADLGSALSNQIATPMEPTIEVLDPRSPQDVLGYEWGEVGTAATDPEAVLDTVQQAVEQGRDLTYSVPLKPVPATEVRELPPTNFDQPGGAKWIDVNKTTFLATAYEGTTQVNQFIISIGRGGAYETTDGTYYIYLKYDHQVMKGGTGQVEGRYEYVTPVDWVSYFNADQAFHEADWNTYQGTWQERVSHGCVNMTSDNAHWIYDWAPVGTKVVVHY